MRRVNTSGTHIYPLLAILLITLFWGTKSEANNWQPWESHTPSQKQESEAITLNPLKQGVRFFQRYISVVDSPRCPMYPTCSAYALQALEKHGAIVGSFLTVDRLLHESNPLEKKHLLTGYEIPRYYDPVSANDFWLSSTIKD